MSKKQLLSGGVDDATTLPSSVDFDGTNDYLSRSSDLVGNADGKTFTFSCYYYHTGVTSYLYSANASVGDNTFYIQVTNTGKVSVANYNGSWDINVQSATNMLATNSFNHVLISADSAALTLDIYVNEIYSINSTESITNNNFSFAQDTIELAARDALYLVEGRLSNVFLDYTYRDLSIEANRRLFITADGKPAEGQAALTPIIYLPMDDPETCHINEGTGGNFVQNGTIGRSNRGPNQDNCVASEFLGTQDLSRTSVTGISNSKTFTCSYSIEPTADSTAQTFQIQQSNSNRFLIQLRNSGGGGSARVFGYNTAGTNILDVETVDSFFVVGRNTHISLSFDLTDTTKTRLAIDGAIVATSDNVFSDDLIDFTADEFNVANHSETTSVGEFYFDTSYIDLSTSNPFWDSETNKPIPVRNVIENTGVTPLIALPLRADDAGNNLGTGGDFTVNSGPFVGARGGSEYWARSMSNPVNSVNTNFLSASGLGSGTTNSGSIVFAFKVTDTSVSNSFMLDVGNISFHAGSDGYMQLWVNGAALLGIANAFTTTDYHLVYFSINGTTSMGLTIPSLGYSNYSNTANVSIDLAALMYIGSNTTENDFQGNIAHTYFTNQYIDFSQESNRLLFVDGLGFPVPLQPSIDEGLIPEGLIRMGFEDPEDLGYNSGSGGNFTVNGNVKSGADFNV